MRNDLRRLQTELSAATGADRGLDARLHAAAYGAGAAEIPPYTSSVDACLVLIHERLPEWHCHIGYGPRGIFPYAMLTHDPDDAEARSEMSAPTVPLALLGAFIRALQREDPPERA